MHRFVVHILGPCRAGTERPIGRVDLLARDEVDAVAIAGGVPVPPGGRVLLFERTRDGREARLVQEFDWLGAATCDALPAPAEFDGVDAGPFH